MYDILWIEAVYLAVFAVPLYIANMKMLWVLWNGRRNRYNSEFYNIVLLGGVVECIGFSMNLLQYRLPNTNMFTSLILPHIAVWSYWYTPFFFIAYQTYILCQITPLLMALSRMTSICFPLSQNRIWKGRTKWAIPVYFLLPFALVWDILPNRAGFALYPADDKSAVEYVSFDVEHTFAFGAGFNERVKPFVLGCACATFFCNAVTVSMMIALRRQNGKVGRLQVRMLMCAVAVCVLQVLLVAWQFVFAAGLIDSRVMLRFFFPLVLDALYLVPAQLVVLLVRSLRRDVYSCRSCAFGRGAVKPSPFARAALPYPPISRTFASSGNGITESTQQ